MTERKSIGPTGRSFEKCKDSGGLGFMDLNMFNQALLAKQSWRIMRDLESLLSKVLRGRYFRNEDFLNALVGAHSSLA